MIHAAIALGADVIVMALLLLLTDLGVYAIVLSMVVYAVVMCLLNERAMKKYMRHKNPWKKAYLYPLIASVPMGLVAGGVYYGLYFLVPSNFLCLCVSVVLAVIVYFVVYLFVSRPSKEELTMLPGGRILYRVAGKLNLV